MLFLFLWAVAILFGVYTIGILKVIGFVLMTYFAGRLMATKFQSKKAVDIEAYEQHQENIAEARKAIQSSMWWRVVNFGGTGNMKNVSTKELIKSRKGIFIYGFIAFVAYFHKDLLVGNRIDDHTLNVEILFEALGSLSAFVCASGIFLNLREE